MRLFGTLPRCGVHRDDVENKFQHLHTRFGIGVMGNDDNRPRNARVWIEAEESWNDPADESGLPDHRHC